MVSEVDVDVSLSWVGRGIGRHLAVGIKNVGSIEIPSLNVFWRAEMETQVALSIALPCADEEFRGKLLPGRFSIFQAAPRLLSTIRQCIVTEPTRCNLVIMSNSQELKTVDLVQLASFISDLVSIEP